MKKLSLIVLCICAMSLSSCIDLIEEIRLKKDGSGIYTINLDMSEFMRMMGGLDGLSDYIDKEQDSKKSDDKEEPEQEMSPITPPIPLGDNPFAQDTDTLISLAIVAEEKEEIASIDKDILQKSFVRMKTVKEDNIFKMGIEFHFDDIKEIDRFYESLESVAANSERAAMATTPMKFAGNNLFNLKGKTLEYQAGKQDWGLDKIDNDGEIAPMAMMILASATYKRIYEFPGKVKKCDNPLGLVAGNKVIMEMPLKKLMEGKTNMSAKIKFSKRK